MDGSSFDDLTGTEIWLRILNGRLSGGSGCTRYDSDATVDGSSIAFGPVTKTPMGCVCFGDGSFDATYFSALDRVDKLAVDTNDLTLSGDGVMLEFETGDEPR